MAEFRHSRTNAPGTPPGVGVSGPLPSVRKSPHNVMSARRSSRLGGQAPLAGPAARLAAPPDPGPGAITRASARRRGYSRAWDRASKAHLARHPLCRGCLALGRPRLAVLTDHVVPHRGDRARFWDARFWQSSCRWHHDVVKQALEHRFEAGEIGPEDLWLDSPVALELAQRILGPRGGGSNP